MFYNYFKQPIMSNNKDEFSNDIKNVKQEEKEAKKRLKAEMQEADLRTKKAKAGEAEFKLAQTTQKADQAEANEQGKFGSISEPRKSLHTYLRNQNKFEVGSIAILDRKAAILIKICPTILSGLIVFHEYISDNVSGGNLITIILLVGLLASLILAIASTKPSNRGFEKILKNQIKPNYPNKLENSFYTWEFDTFTDYETAMEKVSKSQDLQVGNQVRANYILGKSNSIIAKYLDYAYNAFLISFILSGIVFILS